MVELQQCGLVRRNKDTMQQHSQDSSSKMPPVVKPSRVIEDSNQRIKAIIDFHQGNRP
jgi:uncharacterized protein YecT (DUF1311 family)